MPESEGDAALHARASEGRNMRKTKKRAEVMFRIEEFGVVCGSERILLFVSMCDKLRPSDELSSTDLRSFPPLLP